mmetsp:Transcript_26737/g.35127  ORF Transcript_26737/g.35127 Transcript_26737/m.35127 type:complete len:315 (+) Transcript_26737:37-981(+)
MGRKRKNEDDSNSSCLAAQRDKRVTQGRRMTSLIGEEAEADEAFWGQDAWNVENDEEYSTEEEKPDVFDKDFNDTEESEDESEVVVKETKTKKQKAGAYKEPGPKRPKSKKAPRKSAQTKTSASSGGNAEPMSWVPVERKVLRASTRQKTEEAKIAEEVDAEHKKAMAKRRKSSVKVKGRAGAERFSQEELLKEAALTEIESAKWLEKMSQLAEEKNEDQTRQKNEQQFQTRWHSKRGKMNTVTFPDTESMPEILRWKGTSEANRKIKITSKDRCVITGKVARYKDPKTGYPYYDLNAFKQLRQKFGTQCRRAD